MLVGLGLAGYGTWYRIRHQERGTPDLLGSAPGEGERVQIEVLNASPAAGLGRIATRKLRDARLDVVYFGSDTAPTLDSTQILVRRGPTATGQRVRDALGAGVIRAAPDPARMVDVTVRLGRDFAAIVRQP